MRVALTGAAVMVGVVVIPIVPTMRIVVVSVIVVLSVATGVGGAPGVMVGPGVRVRVRVRIIPCLVVIIVKLSLDRAVESGIGEIVPCSPEDVLEFVRGVAGVVRMHRENTARQDLPVLAMETLEELGVARLI